MFNFFPGQPALVPAQDVEMGVGTMAAGQHSPQPSAHTSYPPVTAHTSYPSVAPEALALIEKQKRTIELCMAQVSYHQNEMDKT
jgi:hypothetical protein